MRFAKSNSFFAVIFILLAGFVFLCVPKSSAADIPLLTWERGKEQNVVLGGEAVPKNWQLELRNNTGKVLEFNRSQPNPQGFVVYSTYVPTDFPAGDYFIEVVEDSGEVNSIMAGVNIVPMQRYSIVEIPRDLKFVNLILCILLTLLSLSRSSKYRDLSYLSPDFPKLENNYLEQIAMRKFSLKSTFLDARIRKLERPIDNLFGFMMIRNEAFIFKLSPNLFRVLPFAAILLGALGGVLGAGTSPSLPYLIFLVLLVISAIDIYSAIFASISFVAVQIIFGNAISVKSLLAIFFSLAGVLFAVLISEMFQLLALKDFERIRSVAIRRLIQNLINVVSAFVAALFFYATTLIAQSLSNDSLDQYQTMIVTSVVVFTISLSKLYLCEYLDNFYSKKNLDAEMKFVEVKRVATPLTAIIFFLIAICLTYAWSERLNTAVIAGVTFTLPYLLIVSRIGLKARVRLVKKAKFVRNVLAETFIIAALTYGLYLAISLRPVASIQKSEILLALGFVFVTLHALAGSVYAKDSVSNQEVAK